VDTIFATNIRSRIFAIHTNQGDYGWTNQEEKKEMSKKRRMAIETKRGNLVKGSKTDYKYTIVIEEVGGTIATKKANGHNLEEALNRLQIIERTDAITQFVEKVPEWLLQVALFGLMGGAALLSEFYDTASWVTGTIGIILISGGFLYFLNRWVNKWRASDND